jgi:hypothetical protein
LAVGVRARASDFASRERKCRYLLRLRRTSCARALRGYLQKRHVNPIRSAFPELHLRSGLKMLKGRRMRVFSQAQPSGRRRQADVVNGTHIVRRFRANIVYWVNRGLKARAVLLNHFMVKNRGFLRPPQIACYVAPNTRASARLVRSQVRKNSDRICDLESPNEEKCCNSSGQFL